VIDERLPSPKDLKIVGNQLGRPARDIAGIAARCVCGKPVVVITKPRLSDGTPFPTFYYLTQPAATKAASRLEAEGKMHEYELRLRQDQKKQDMYRLAHESFMADRDELGIVEEIDGISAGGMPQRVKCLHSLIAHSLAKGPGVNPVGDWALEETPWNAKICQCTEA